MEYEVFLSKNSFLKSLIKEVQVVEASAWELLSTDKKEVIVEKLDYMQELIIQILRVLNDIEVEILLFKVEKSDLGKKVEQELEELYVLIELQKRQLSDIAIMSKEEVAKILDGKRAGIEGFSESSERIKALLEKIESDGAAFSKINDEESVENNNAQNTVENS